MHRAERTIDVLIAAFLKNQLMHIPQQNFLPIPPDKGCALIMLGLPGMKSYGSIEGMRIMMAFEGHWTFNNENDPDSFLGLCAVFDVLQEIDADYFQSRPPIKITDCVTVLERVESVSV